MGEPKELKITLVKSVIGRLPAHRRTVRALGLRRVGRSVVKRADAPVAGMIRQVSYMLKVEEAPRG
jgi:large subunit ribosomal protein L30